MKRILLFIFVVSFSYAKAQISHPVKWSYASKKLPNNEAMLFFKAEIDDGWHIYSLHQAEGGPTATSIQFTPLEGFKLIGNVQEPFPRSRYEDAFGVDVRYFENSVIFQQRIKINGATNVKGKITFMTCNSHQCLPPEDVDFSIPIK